ncbi:MAG: metallophosphoesterase family protein [Kiritimatiellia bacterium]
MTIDRRGFLARFGVFAAAGAMGPAMRALAAVADDAAEPLGAYWAPHLAAVAEKVRARAARTVDGFWFITDLHISANRRQSGKALAALTGLTPIRKTFCGGDLPEAFAAKFESDKAGVDFAVDAYRLHWRDPIEASGQLLYTAKGNHDFTIRHDAKTAAGHTYSAEEACRVVMGSRGCANVVTNPADPTACYYYFDNGAVKIRYVFVDTTDSIDPKRTYWAVQYGMGQTQKVWLAEVAIATLPAGWCAVIVHHIPLTGCVGDAGDARRFRDFREFLEAYQNRGKVAFAGKDYDFADAQGRILLDITGHHHAERQTFQRGILHVTEPCDAAYGDYIIGSKPWCGELPRKQKGTVNEQTFDAVQLDPAHNLVYFTRVGGGQDRVIHTAARVVRAGGALKLAAPHLAGAVTWGCYDADRIIHTPNPRNKYNPFVTYANDYATITADGTLSAKAAGDVMAIAMDAHLNKEIIPVRIDA